VQGQSNLDIFEFIYFARPDSMLLGKRVYEVRGNLGRQLYREKPTQADVVIGVPDSALPAALAYAQEAGIPYGDGFIKNRYIHRTFIQPEQHLRNLSVQRKLNPLPEVVRGRRVIVIDDSIVRGTNAGPIIKLLRNAGAREVHMKISSPPVLYPDFYGIDTPHQHKLIAARMNLKELTEYIGADSLQYLSYEGMIASTGLSEDLFSTSCFTGIYPIDIREQRQNVSNIVFQFH
jgi:amidophosphoribosyltransferase